MWWDGGSRIKSLSHCKIMRYIFIYSANTTNSTTKNKSHLS